MAEPSCGGRVGVTTSAEPTEELRSDGGVVVAESELLWRGTGARRSGGDCVSESGVAVHRGRWTLSG